MNERGTIVGLTGGIGAGKTTVAEIFESRGAVIVDADDVARDVVAPGSVVLEKIADLLGADVVGSDGRLDRDRVADRVFGSEPLRRAYEGIIHPAIADASRQRFDELARASALHIVYEAALLIEAGRDSEMDYTVVVVADDEVRRQRLRDRGLSTEDAERRIAAQMPQDEKAQRADFVIDNSGTLSSTAEQVDAVWEKVFV